MNDKKYCTVCTEKCSYTMHTNATFIIDIKMEKENTTLKYLKKNIMIVKVIKLNLNKLGSYSIKMFEYIRRYKKMCLID